MSRNSQRASSGRRVCGVFALLSLSALLSGCSGSSEAGSTAKFDPGKEAEQQKVADQHAANVAKQREYMTSHMPAGTPTGPPPSSGK